MTGTVHTRGGLFRWLPASPYTDTRAEHCDQSEKEESLSFCRRCHDRNILENKTAREIRSRRAASFCRLAAQVHNLKLAAMTIGYLTVE
jgi:hypothetical protein